MAADRFPRRRYALGQRVARRRADRADAINAYRRELADRAAAARAQLLADGIHLGPIPYGYLRCERRLVPNPHTAYTVTVVFWLWALENASVGEITRTLSANPRIFPAPVPARRVGAIQTPRWAPRQVARILANPRYTGRQVLTPARPGLTGITPAVVTSERVHRELVDDELYRRAAQRAGRPLPVGFTPAIQSGGGQ